MGRRFSFDWMIIFVIRFFNHIIYVQYVYHTTTKRVNQKHINQDDSFLFETQFFTLKNFCVSLNLYADHRYSRITLLLAIEMQKVCIYMHRIPSMYKIKYSLVVIPKITLVTINEY